MISSLKEAWEEATWKGRILVLFLFILGFSFFWSFADRLMEKDQASMPSPKSTLNMEEGFSDRLNSLSYNPKNGEMISELYEKNYLALQNAIDRSLQNMDRLMKNNERGQAVPFTRIENVVIEPVNSSMWDFYGTYEEYGIGGEWKDWFSRMVPIYSQFSIDYFYTMKGETDPVKQHEALLRAKKALTVFQEEAEKTYKKMYFSL